MHIVFGEVKFRGDVGDNLTGLLMFPQNLRADASHCGSAEAGVRFHAHRRSWVVVRAPSSGEVTVPGHALEK